MLMRSVTAAWVSIKRNPLGGSGYFQGAPACYSPEPTPVRVRVVFDPQICRAAEPHV